MVLLIMLIALLGLIISLYSYWVERQLLQNVNYKPACDISDHISCSKPFTSIYSAVLGISNTVVSIIYFTSMFWLAVGDFNKLMFIGACIAVIFTLYLAYLLYFKIRSFCLICTSLYIVNVLMLVATYYNLYR